MLISVIIPAYNCSGTLVSAVESVVCGFDDIEIIIIDDGSVDSTPAVISSLKEKYSFIKSKRIKNSGPANARNEGIKTASGDYIMFIDSDDSYEKSIFSIVAPLLASSPDILIFGFRQRFAEQADDKIYSLNEPFNIDLYYKNNLLNQVWNKVYKREFLLKNNIYFKDYKYGEDRIFNADALKCNPSVITVPDVLYNYNIDKSVSLISGYEPKKFTACKEIYNNFSTLCKSSDVPRYMFLKNILSCMTVMFADNCRLTKAEKKAEINKILSDNSVKESMCEKLDGTAVNIVRKIIKTGSVTLNYSFAKCVAICQKKFLPLFLKFRG